MKKTMALVLFVLCMVAFAGCSPDCTGGFLQNKRHKTIYTFSTSGSSSDNGTYNGLRNEYTEIAFAGNLHLTSSQLSSTETRVSEWLTGIGII